MTTYDPWAILTIGLIGLGIGIAWTVLSFPLAVLVGRMFARREDEVAVETVPDETPIYTATISHIAKHAAAELDDEWVRVWRLIGDAS